ncbi:MAG: 50S ribosomal protein L11 methyltransferase [Aestuariivirga sp.]
MNFTLTISSLNFSEAHKLSEIADNGFASAVAINETGEGPSRWELVVYFNSKVEAESARGAGVIAPLPEVDWVRRSLEGLPPVSAGRFFLHGFHDRHRRRIGGISLEIDAGTAFGTGHHATTEGCLMALEKIIKKRRPRRILDVGCGSGVLAIAAVKASRTRALASDIDPEAVAVTRRNAKANGVAPAITAIAASGLKHPRIQAGALYDLIFANILARPLVSLAQGLSLVLAPGGALILSGLTRDQVRWVRATYRNRGLVIDSARVESNWATLVVTRKPLLPQSSC